MNQVYFYMDPPAVRVPQHNNSLNPFMNQVYFYPDQRIQGQASGVIVLIPL